MTGNKVKVDSDNFVKDQLYKLNELKIKDTPLIKAPNKSSEENIVTADKKIES